MKRIFFAKLRALFRKEELDRDMAEEMHFHLAQRAADHIEDGLSPGEARYAALRKFGNVGVIQEATRDQRGVRWVENLGRDIRFGARRLRKERGFTAVAVLTLALGIGANTAIFSIVHAVLLQPLPFTQPERLVGLRESNKDETQRPMAWRTYAEFRDRAQTLDGIAALNRWGGTLELGTHAVQLRGMSVSPSYFRTLGVQPILGRDFLSEEAHPRQAPVLILGQGLWRQHFNSDPGILGRWLRVDGVDYTVVGVMAELLHGEAAAQQLGWATVWTVLQVDEAAQSASRSRWVKAVARLKEGVTLAQTRTELDQIMEEMKRQYPETHPDDCGILVRPLHEIAVGEETRRSLLLLFGAVSFVLLIACANVANLLLARAAGRRKEMAMRAALGASRWSLIRQLLTECLLLALSGAAVGVLLAQWGISGFRSLGAQFLPRAEEIALNPAILVFALILAFLTSVIAGLTPAFAVVDLGLNKVLQEGGCAASQSARQNQWRGGFVVGELALASLLLVGAGLLLKSFAKLRGLDPGFDSQGVLTLHVRLPSYRYGEPSQRIDFFQRSLERIGQLPGVIGAAAVQSLLLKGEGYTDLVQIEGHTIPLRGAEPVRRQNTVTPDYFRVVGMRLLKGRFFTAQDAWQQSDTIIVNESFARKFWPSDDPLGKRLKAGRGDPPWSTVIGVVADTVQPGLENSAADEMFYPYVNAAGPPMLGMNLVVRTSLPPAAMATTVQEQIRALDPQVPITEVSTLGEWARKAVNEPRFNTILLGLFSAVAAVLAAIGIYGVMSYSVTQRTHEIGVRMALGAQPRNVLYLVMRQGLRLVLMGVTAGIAAALALAGTMRSLLFEVEPADPLAFAGVALLLGAITLVACWLPARRAAKVDPMMALRAE